MPTKTQPIDPNPAATSPITRTKKQEEVKRGPGRAGSAGGIVLENETVRSKMSPALAKAPTPPTQAKAASTAAPAQASTGPNRQRRRPRKLNKDTETEVKAATPSAAAAPATNAKETVLPASTQEIEALKSRVRGLEAKVEELYKEGVDRRDKSPRRRGKARKDSSQQQVPTLSTPEPSGKVVEVEDEADEELGRLEDELEVARRDLESFQPRSARPRGKRTTSGDTEYIEEIPRGNVGEVEDTVDTGDRQVTLTGSYRIPLPTKVNMKDVKTIQSGVTAAQNVARSFLEQRRAQQALNSSQPSKAAPKKTSGSSALAKAGEEGDKKSWGEWFGGYSMAISRAVNTIEAEAAVESQRAAAATTSVAKRPAQKRTTSAPSTKGASSTPKPKAGTAAKGAQRPSMKSRAANLSSEQVDGLMS